MEAYIVPDWLKVVAGLVVHQRRKGEIKVLFGLRSARKEANKWCLPTGEGAVRRDITSAFLATLAADGAKSLKDLLEDPTAVVQSMSKRHQQAFLSPAGFALAEAKWYVEILSEVEDLNLIPLRPVCQFDKEKLLVKIYFGLVWTNDEPPKPAVTEWPFKEVRFFSREELKNVPVAFGCDKDLERIFWFQGSWYGH